MLKKGCFKKITSHGHWNFAALNSIKSMHTEMDAIRLVTAPEGNTSQACVISEYYLSAD